MRSVLSRAARSASQRAVMSRLRRLPPVISPSSARVGAARTMKRRPSSTASNSSVSPASARRYIGSSSAARGPSTSCRVSPCISSGRNPAVRRLLPSQKT